MSINRDSHCIQVVAIIISCIQTLFEQFRYFLNFMFLVMALTQFVPVLAVGLWYTYWFPLVCAIRLPRSFFLEQFSNSVIRVHYLL